ncbi:hypothetical protein BDV96DRAFT_482712 [Lophiotrema nucula]|uniref:RRM domain-containing protein n=1 Tax=Lophiotrema nucula TaxID=690887 RepID=A0A6A5ZS27_9PLEO|nr:hypothetical protein BDV96DRAFT_482712 [Lophiotrema nucula]
MRSSPSPPQEPEQTRHKSLTPESPKPVHYPSPSNIPILEKQMEPGFSEASLNIPGTPASSHSYTQTQTPSAQSTTSFYAEQQNGSVSMNTATQSALGAPNYYSQTTSYSGGVPQTQDTSIQALQPHNQAPAAQYREANATPAQDSRPAYPQSYDINAYAAQPYQALSAQNGQYNPNAGGNVNVQALLDSLSPTANSGSSERNATASQPSQSQGQTPISSIPVAANLPPRPPAQDNPTTHANYDPNVDIRAYHPHSGKPPNNQYRGNNQLQTLNTRGAQGYQEVQSATRSNQSPSTPGYGHRQSVDLASASADDDEDERWPPEINKLYEDFLDEERKFVTDGQWEKFPAGSRLFIGNLPTEKVTKRDIFHRFYRHGQLAQISIKQAYGFVQFLDAQSCHRALQAEQGKPVRGRNMHLEISKPQRNTKKNDGHNNDRNGARRRSRSPDYTRGGSVSQPRNVDRYTGSQSALSPRARDSRRYRDDYRSRRSPSPRGPRGGRGRDRSRDRYDGWRRSPSRSPRRFRSPSPRRQESLDDGLPLPRRAADQVPDVQVLAVNNLPRDYIEWVEETFRRQGLRIDVLVLSPRLSEDAVIQRQIVEGVLAIVKLNPATLAKSKVNLQVFDRSGGANVRFNDLEPSTATALVLQAKQTQDQPAPPAPAHQYGQSYSMPSVYVNPAHLPNQYMPSPNNNSGNISNLISALDSNGLSQLLGAMSGTPTPAVQAPPANPGADLARLLGSMSTPAPATPYAAPAPSTGPGYPNAQSNFASFPGYQPQHQVQQQQQHSAHMQTATQTPTAQPDMNEIMRQLAKYQR